MSIELQGAEYGAQLAALGGEDVSEAEQTRAALVVCGHSRDAAEAKELLIMLGLVEERGEDEEPEADEEAAAPADDWHGHAVGLASHVEAGEELCAACAELFELLRTSGIVREVAK